MVYLQLIELANKITEIWTNSEPIYKLEHLYEADTILDIPWCSDM